MYKLEYHSKTASYNLARDAVVYTRFQAALDTMTTPHVGDVSDFLVENVPEIVSIPIQKSIISRYLC